MLVSIIMVYLSFVFFSGTKSLEGIKDPLQIIKIIRENDKIGFLYLSNAVPKTSVDYHYYNLKVSDI